MTQPLTLRKNLSYLIHVLAWVLMGSMFFLLTPLSWKVELPQEFWVRQGMFFITMVVLFYVNRHLLVPRLLFKGKIGLFLVFTLGICFLLMYMIEYFESWMNLPELMHQAFHPDEKYVPKERSFSLNMFILLVLFLAVGISTSVAAVQKWQADEALRRQLDQQRINSELSYLKAQINPHFFFNTLNNIYSLTNIDVERAQIALHKLSRMMRYVLYETEKDRTLLSKEINFINDFIELMRLRISEKVKIHLDIPEKMEERVIAPMLLLPFIENCFKHGISSQQESPITISLKLIGDTLHLHTVNRIVPVNPNSPEAQSQGIGLANTQRRLSLLYGKKFDLQIDDQNDANEYRVDLKITLA